MNPETQEPFDFNEPAVKASLVPWAGGAQNIAAVPTFREALVSLGHWTRNTFGAQTFSRLAADAAADALVHFDSVIFPAVRTPDDLSRLIDPNIDRSEYLLIRLFRDTCDWRGDLGGYLSPLDLNIPHIDIHNNGSLEDLFAAVLSAIGAHENV